MSQNGRKMAKITHNAAKMFDFSTVDYEEVWTGLASQIVKFVYNLQLPMLAEANSKHFEYTWFQIFGHNLLLSRLKKSK